MYSVDMQLKEWKDNTELEKYAKVRLQLLVITHFNIV